MTLELTQQQRPGMGMGLCPTDREVGWSFMISPRLTPAHQPKVLAQKAHLTAGMVKYERTR